MQLFRRRVSVASGGALVESPPFDIHFQLRFDTEPEPNQATIDIFNLADSTVNKFKCGQTVILNAGYEADSGTILAGITDEVRSFWQTVRGAGNERILRLEAGDATDRWLNARISKAYKAGIKASQIIADMLKMFGLEIGAFKLPKDVTYPGGRTFSGSLQSALRQVVSDCGAKMHISNGAVFVLPPDQGNRIAVVLRHDTGLVEYPERIETQDGEEKWRVISLLNHRIRADSIIKVESRNLTGFCRVVKGEHVCGDEDFETRLEVVPA
jgi:hypothetical protein